MQECFNWRRTSRELTCCSIAPGERKEGHEHPGVSGDMPYKELIDVGSSLNYYNIVNIDVKDPQVVVLIFNVLNSLQYDMH